MSSCDSCKYFDSNHSDCRRLISATSVAPNDICGNYKPKQEEKQRGRCKDCVYYNGQQMLCLVTQSRKNPSQTCGNYKLDITQQEEKQMKDCIVEKHEVKLDGTWCQVIPVVDTESKIMFHDPRQQPTPAAPVPGAFLVSHLMIYKSDPYYRTSRTMRVVLNKNMQIVTSFNPNDAVSPALEVDQRYATVILD